MVINFPKSPSNKELGRFFSRAKRRIFKHVWIARGLVLGLFLGVLAVLLYFIVQLVSGSSIPRYLNLTYLFLRAPVGSVRSIDGRTNILVLGKGGEGHTAKDLTDTIIFVSIPHGKGKLVLVSLPRDIWIPELRAKLNSAYYWGNKKTPGGGVPLAKSLVEEITGIPIHYGVVMDFAGFKKIIDTLGGVDVLVEREFTDFKYPIEGKENDECGGKDPEFSCRYETVHFDAGLQAMSGDQALKFVRSRNAEGDEGTDLARAARQQRVIEAIEKRVFTSSRLRSFKGVNELINAVSSSVETDINLETSVILARKGLSSKDKVSSSVLKGEFLENPPISSLYDYQYVFIPKVEEWKEVHSWIEGLLN